jgi:hypothetical protein
LSSSCPCIEKLPPASCAIDQTKDQHACDHRRDENENLMPAGLKRRERRSGTKADKPPAYAKKRGACDQAEVDCGLRGPSEALREDRSLAIAA